MISLKQNRLRQSSVIKKSSKKRRLLIIVFSLLLFFMIVVTFIGGLTVYGGYRFWKSVSNWSLEEEKWSEIPISIKNSLTSVTFLYRNAHPFLAEYFYQLKVSKDGQIFIYDLPMNTGGIIDEPVYLIDYKGDLYVEVRQTLVNMNTLQLLANGNPDMMSNHEDVEYYEVLLNGKRSQLGKITYSKKEGYIFTNDQESQISNSKISWTEWKELPSITGRIRFGSIPTSASSDLDERYIEIANATTSKEFYLGHEDVLEYQVQLLSYKNLHFVVLQENYRFFYNFEQLMQMEAGTISYQKGKPISEVEFGSSYLNEVTKDGKSQKIGTVYFSKTEGATFE